MYPKGCGVPTEHSLTHEKYLHFQQSGPLEGSVFSVIELLDAVDLLKIREKKI
jgi:hypothetical protein